MEQMEAFPNDVCVSRHGGNPESEAAHADVLPRKGAARLRVLEYVRSLGTKGGNNWEIAQHWGIEQNAVSPRVSELLITGEVVDSHIRRPTRSGLKARVVIAREHRVELIRELRAKGKCAEDEMGRRYLLSIAEKLEADEMRETPPADWEAQIDESY